MYGMYKYYEYRQFQVSSSRTIVYGRGRDEVVVKKIFRLFDFTVLVLTLNELKSSSTAPSLSP